MKLQLFLLLYSIKNSALKLITIIFSFFLPIAGILGLLFTLILADTATGIWKAKHLKQKQAHVAGLPEILANPLFGLIQYSRCRGIAETTKARRW